MTWRWRVMVNWTRRLLNKIMLGPSFERLSESNKILFSVCEHILNSDPFEGLEACAILMPFIRENVYEIRAHILAKGLKP